MEQKIAENGTIIYNGINLKLNYESLYEMNVRYDIKDSFVLDYLYKIEIKSIRNKKIEFLLNSI